MNLFLHLSLIYIPLSYDCLYSFHSCTKYFKLLNHMSIKWVFVTYHPLYAKNILCMNHQNVNQEVFLNNSVLSQATQPTEDAVPGPQHHYADVPAPQPTLPSSSPQLISARPARPIFISDEEELPLAKKSLFECEKCKGC